MNIRIIIADDNSFVREGLRIILNTFNEFTVLATVQDGQEAVDYCEQNEVDIALLDVQMPNMNGVEATKRITERTKTKTLILTTFDNDDFVFDAIKNGAKGYLLKNNDPEQIRDAIKAVYNGHNVLQDAVLDKLKTNLITDQQPKEQERARIDQTLFTDRELDIMTLIAKGMTNKEISKRLFISEGTIANHITSILSKTGLIHRTQIAIYYLTGEVGP